MMIWIRDVYDLDMQAATVEERAKLRHQQAPTILARMRTWMHEQRVPHIEGAPVGRHGSGETLAVAA